MQPIQCCCYFNLPSRPLFVEHNVSGAVACLEAVKLTPLPVKAVHVSEAAVVQRVADPDGAVGVTDVEVVGGGERCFLKQRLHAQADRIDALAGQPGIGVVAAEQVHNVIVDVKVADVSVKGGDNAVCSGVDALDAALLRLVVAP